MPGRCTVCRHPRLEEIDRAIVGGASHRQIAADFGVTRQAVQRHSANGHVAAALLKAKDAAELVRADGLLGEVQALRDRALDCLTKAEAAGDLSTALKAIREARGSVELLAKLEGQLQTAPNVNVLITPVWRDIAATLLIALDPYPEARGAAADALLALEERTRAPA